MIKQKNNSKKNVGKYEIKINHEFNNLKIQKILISNNELFIIFEKMQIQKKSTKNSNKYIYIYIKYKYKK